MDAELTAAEIVNQALKVLGDKIADGFDMRIAPGYEHAVAYEVAVRLNEMYPKYKYSPNSAPLIVLDAEEEARLPAEWQDLPCGGKFLTQAPHESRARFLCLFPAGSALPAASHQHPATIPGYAPAPLLDFREVDSAPPMLFLNFKSDAQR